MPPRSHIPLRTNATPGGFIFGEIPKLLWVSIDGVVFAVHEDQLRRTSPFFDTMLQLPPGSSPQEGSSEAHPLPLDSHASPEQWAAYWKYIYRPHYSQQPEQPTQEYWMDLLAVGAKFEVNAAVHDAKEALKLGGPFALPPPLLLNLGRQYLFDDWVSDAAHAIANTPVLSIAPPERRLLGEDTVMLLAELQIKLSQHRANLAIALPGQLRKHASSCLQEMACQSAWVNVCLHLTRLLIRQSRPVSETHLLSVITSKAAEASLMAEMSMDCAQTVINQCRSALTGRDDQLFARIISQVSSLHLVPRKA